MKHYNFKLIYRVECKVFKIFICSIPILDYTSELLCMYKILIISL